MFERREYRDESVVCDTLAAVMQSASAIDAINYAVHGSYAVRKPIDHHHAER